MYIFPRHQAPNFYRVLGVDDEIAMDLARKLEFSDDVVPSAAAEIKKLYELFMGVDATQVSYSILGPLLYYPR